MRLTVGYVPNQAKTDLEHVVISCQIGDEKHYAYQIDDPEGMILPAPAAAQGPDQPPSSQALTKRKPR